MTGGGYSRIAAASTKARFNNKPKGGARYAAAAAAGHPDLNRGFFAAMAEALASAFSRRLTASARARAGRPRTTRYAPNGGAECERRQRQMARGKIIDAMPVRPGWTPPRWLRRADTQHIRAGVSLRAANFRR